MDLLNLPSILFGGPPHSGKSTLIYNLSIALRHLAIPHGVLRACPDGQSDWYNAGDDNLVQHLSHKGPWTKTFVKRVVAAINERKIPLLVDAGGQPRRWQLPILEACTHAVLLVANPPTQSATGLATSFAEETAYWQQLCAQCQVPVIATLASVLKDAGQETPSTPQLDGILTGLHQGKLDAGPDFDSFKTLIQNLLAKSQLTIASHPLSEANADQKLDLPVLARKRGNPSGRWEPDWLPSFLETIIPYQSVAAYGPSATWLLAAVALRVMPQQVLLFDKHHGWVQPPALLERAEPHVRLQEGQNLIWAAKSIIKDPMNILTLNRNSQHLDIYQPEQYPLPHLPDGPLLISGNLPQWLTVAIALKVSRVAFPWLALHQPYLGNAVVVQSHTTEKQVGDLIPVPDIAENN